MKFVGCPANVSQTYQQRMRFKRGKGEREAMYQVVDNVGGSQESVSEDSNIRRGSRYDPNHANFRTIVVKEIGTVRSSWMDDEFTIGNLDLNSREEKVESARRVLRITVRKDISTELIRVRCPYCSSNRFDHR